MKKLPLLMLVLALAGCSTLVTEEGPDHVIVDVEGRNDAMRQQAFDKANAACQQYGKVAYRQPIVHDRGILDGAHYILQFECVAPTQAQLDAAKLPPR